MLCSFKIEYYIIKGRRNRVKQKDTNHIQFTSKDNHQQQQQQHHNHKASNNNTYSQSTNNNSNSNGANDNNDVHQSQQNNKQTAATVQKVCESCQRLENELKKLKTDISHMKQVENELKQKMESASSVKSSLQAKQKENEELDKK